VVLLRSIALGRLWLDQLVKGSVTSLDAIVAREGCSRRHVERTISNAFLAPQIIKAAVDGQLPRGVNAKALMNAPAEWTQQWNALGLPRS
jgi:site-specific DNA recombinase